MKYLGSISNSMSHVTKEYVDDAISNIGGGSGGSYDDSELREELSKKADVDGVYPEMTVGMTRDMLGVGEGDEGEFLFRPTDGEGSIKDGFASIESIKGNSLVWNQYLKNDYASVVVNGVTITNNGNGSKTINGTASADVWHSCDHDSFKSVVGHKYLLYGCPQGGSMGTFCLFEANGLLTPDEGMGSITQATSDVLRPYVVIRSGVACNNLVFKPRIVDLTKMFGAGNEPSTVEEFYQRIPKGIDINAYNEGEVVNMNVEGIKSVGFNAWDEEWENGVLTANGDNAANGSFIRSKNYIPVIGGATYYYSCRKEFYNNYIVIKYYDNNLASIGQDTSSGQFNVPKDCAYMRFYVNDTYGSTYNNDICIHLVHTGYRNGEYEPYVSDEIALPILNYFPNGMRSIGDVKDELTATEAIQRIGVVDLGTLDWAYSTYGSVNAFSTVTIPMKNNGAEIKSARYTPNYLGGVHLLNNLEMMSNPNYPYLYIRDDSYTDSTSFKAAMSGVMLYYELAEPIVTSIDKPLALDYQVWDFGTEEAIAEGKTTPLKASIVYEFNARDTIRKNRNDIAKLNEELLQLKTTIGAGPYVLNATILDLNRAIQYYEGEQNITDLAEIRNALVNHRTIHIKYGSNFDGYFVVNGYIDGTDMITLEFWFGLTQYSIEIDTTSKIGYVSTYDA